MAGANGRLMKELAEVGKDDSSGVNAKPKTEGNLRHLIGTINGPSSTVYEGGVFEIDITIPKQYPFEPPKMKFTTKVWHPNISSQTGAICLVSVLALLCCGDESDETVLMFLFHDTCNVLLTNCFEIPFLCRIFSKTNGVLLSLSKRRCCLCRHSCVVRSLAIHKTPR